MGFVRQPWDPYFHAKSKSFQPQRLRGQHENTAVQKYLELGFYELLFKTTWQSVQNSGPRKALNLLSFLRYVGHLSKTRSMRKNLIAAVLIAFVLTACGLARASEMPNVLFIAIDDLNHWVGHLGRNPQTRTPNIDRFASSGVAFTQPIARRRRATRRGLR